MRVVGISFKPYDEEGEANMRGKVGKKNSRGKKTNSLIQIELKSRSPMKEMFN
jgi:hypothetical protein